MQGLDQGTDRVIAVDIKILTQSRLVILGTRLEVTISKRYFQSGAMIDNMQNRFTKNPKIFSLWYSGSDFSYTFQRKLTLGRCLGIDNMTTPSKFSEVM